MTGLTRGDLSSSKRERVKGLRSIAGAERFLIGATAKAMSGVGKRVGVLM